MKTEKELLELVEENGWNFICNNQKLSEKFMDKHLTKEQKEIQLKRHHDKRTLKEKQEEVTVYAKKHKLKIKDGYLYAFREHDQWGRGMFNNTLTYDKGYTYRDWRCDLDPENENSFGLGIWPKGNTPVRVKIKDWGCEVKENNGKGRVWEFETI